MFFAQLVQSHAVLPAFLLGLVVARVFHKHPQLERFQVVAFAFLTPFFLNAGIIDRTQFSVLVTVVVLTAVLPTLVAQRWFTPQEAHAIRRRGRSWSREM